MEQIELTYLDLAAAVVNRARDDYFHAREILEAEEKTLTRPHRGSHKISELTKAIVAAVARNESGLRATIGDIKRAMGVNEWDELTEDEGLWFCSCKNRKNVLDKAADIKRRRNAEEMIEEVKEFLCSEWFDTLTLSVCDPAELWREWNRLYKIGHLHT